MTEDACIIGMFRSGSNFLRALLERNYACRIGYNSFGWKHGLFPIIAGGAAMKMPGTPTITLTKNPFSAIASLHRYYLGNGRNLVSGSGAEMGDFLRAPLVIRDDANPESAELFFPTVADCWVAMTWNVMSIVGRRPASRHLRYEDLVADPEGQAARLAGALGLARVSEVFDVPRGRMRNLPGRAVDWQREETEMNRPFGPSSVCNHAYMAAFSEADRAFVLSRLPVALLERTGYDALVRDLAATGTSERARHGEPNDQTA